MIKKIKERLVGSIKGKRLNTFLFFFCIAFLFLCLSKLSKTYTQTIAFNVELVNVPEGRSIEKHSDSVLLVTVEALGFKLVSYAFKQPKIRIDTAKDVFVVNEQYFWLSKNGTFSISERLGQSVQIKSILPDTLKFPFQKLAVKKVPVKLIEDIKFNAGYDVLGNYKISPDSISIIGPDDKVNEIEFVTTKSLNLIDIQDNIRADVEVDDSNQLIGVEFSNASVFVEAEVVKFTEGIIDVPVTIVNVPSNVRLNYFPKTVQVSFYVDLNRFKQISALDFKVECDYNQIIDGNKTSFTPKLVKYSKIVKSTRLKQNKIEFVILK